MSTTDDTAPAAEIENAELATEGLGDTHQPIPQVGETPEPAPEPAPVAAAPAPAAKIDPAAKPEAEQPFWYRKEIEKERKARQAAERRASDLENRAPAPRREPTEQDDPNRPLTRAELEHYRQQDALIGRLERSEERFTDKHGEEAFDQTREWLATRPDIEAWALGQRNPWQAAFSQYQKEKLASEIGEDPNAWRESEKARMRQELLAEIEAERPAPAAPTMQTRAAPPAPASTARSAAPRDPAGRFAGPRPIGELSKNKFS